MTNSMRAFLKDLAVLLERHDVDADNVKISFGIYNTTECRIEEHEIIARRVVVEEQAAEDDGDGEGE